MQNRGEKTRGVVDVQGENKPVHPSDDLSGPGLPRAGASAPLGAHLVDETTPTFSA